MEPVLWRYAYGRPQDTHDTSTDERLFDNFTETLEQAWEERPKKLASTVCSPAVARRTKVPREDR
jgi:hypothetical protein